MGGLIEDLWSCKIPKISPGAYFSKALFEGLIFGGAYIRLILYAFQN